MSISAMGRRVLLALALVVIAGCPPDGPGHPAVDFFAITYDRVQVLDEDTGQWQDWATDTASSNIPFGERTKVSLSIRAIPETGTFDGFVKISANPGEVLGIESADSEIMRTAVHVAAGTTTRVDVEFNAAYGETRLWVEDVGVELAGTDPESWPCDDGVDNDGDGFVDYPLDPGCYSRNDGSETGGTHSTGVSEIIHFSKPRLADAQGCGPVPPLSRQAVNVDRGQLIVTAVVNNGFYVSDFAAIHGGCDPASGCCSGGRYAHMFVYNFNTPYAMRVCDELDRVGGTVDDFYGFTEMSFPSWDSHDIDEDPTNGLTLMRDAPEDLTPALCPLESHVLTGEEIRNQTIMESWEAGLVEIVNAEIPAAEDWVDCDYNGDGEVAYYHDMDVCVPSEEARVGAPYCTTGAVCCELECNDVCQGRLCAELTTFRQFGQYPLMADGARILVVTGSGAPDFDARELARAGVRTIDRLTGTLKEFSPLDTPWIIQPRCRQDIHIQTSDNDYPDVPIFRRCVPSEETGDYEDPY